MAGAPLSFACPVFAFASEGAGFVELRFGQRLPARVDEEDAEEEENGPFEAVAELVAAPLFKRPLRLRAYSSQTSRRDMSERVEGTKERSFAANAASLNAGLALASMQSAAAASVI